MEKTRYCQRCYISQVSGNERYCPTCKQAMRRDAEFERYAYRQALEENGPRAAARERDVMDYLANNKLGYYDES